MLHKVVHKHVQAELSHWHEKLTLQNESFMHRYKKAFLPHKQIGMVNRHGNGAGNTSLRPRPIPRLWGGGAGRGGEIPGPLPHLCFFFFFF